MGEPRWLDVSEYAELMSLDEQSVRKMCRDGRLNAKKMGKVWRIPYSEPVDTQASKIVHEAVIVAITPLLEQVDTYIENLTGVRDSLSRLMEGEA